MPSLKLQSLTPYFMMSASKLILIITHATLKDLSQVFQTFHIMAFMFDAIIILRILYFFLIGPGNLFLEIKDTRNFLLITGRHLLASISMGLLLLSIKYISIGVANAIFNMTPIFMELFEAFLYKKKLNYGHFMLTVASFIGILFIIEPKFLFNRNDSQISTFFVFVALVSALINSVSMLLIYEIKKTEVSQTTVLQLYVLFQGYFGSVIANFQEEAGEVEIKGWMILWSLAMIFSNIVSQILLYRSLYLGNPTYVVPFTYTGIIFSVFVDFYYFDEQLSWVNLVGIFLTSIGLISQVILSK